VDLAPLVLVFINGTNKTEYKRIKLSDAGPTLPSGGYLVVANPGVMGIDMDALVIRFTAMADNIQNGAPDGVAIFNTATNTIVDALSYEGAITAAVITGAPGTYNLVEGTVLPTSVADSNTAAGSLVRFPNGADTNDAATDWKFTTLITPGGPNLMP
jgi:large repetitive protein